MADFLLKDQGFAYVHVLTESEATKEKIDKIMTDEMPRMIGPNDRFIFYFSGHGAQRIRTDNRRSFGFLPLFDSKKEEFSGMISMLDIERWNDYLQARHTLFILDACFSGLAGTEKKSQSPRMEQLSLPARYLITAGTGEEETISSDQWGGSLFTDELISVVRDGVGATDGVISIYSLIDSVQSRVAIVTENAGWHKGLTPQIRDLQGSDGAFFFRSGHGQLSEREIPKPDSKSVVSKGMANVGDATEARLDSATQSQSPTAMPAADCKQDMQTLAEARSTELLKVNEFAKASRGKPMDPAGFCVKSKGLVTAEVALIAYMEKNKDWCSFPNEAIAQLKEHHAKNADFSAKACQVAGKDSEK